MTNPISLILDKKNTRFRIVEHIGYWVFYFLFYILYISYSYKYNILLSIRDHGLYLIVDISVSYFIIYLTDKFLEKKKYILLIFLSAISFVIGIILYRITYYYAISYYFYNITPHHFWDYKFLDYAYGLFFPVAIINILHLVRKWVHSQKEMYEISKSKIIQELSFLKIQLNQHFLFNTLNNIDSLIYSDPETASQTIVNLSNLLRYSIYETDVQYVPVKKEIEYINTFIELYELRLTESDKIELKISGDYEDLCIVPRLFIPFVENALIYGKKDDDSKIYISITFVDNKVTLCTMNQLKEIKLQKPGGVGIKNVKRTLDLIYRGKYNLEIYNTNNWYTSKLTIELGNERNNELYNN